MKSFITNHLGVLALVMGIITISFSPLLVQLSEVGPTATAGYRMLFALPALSVWLYFEKKSESPPKPLTKKSISLLVLAGIFFAGDLLAWHSSIKMSGVANATFLAHLSTPIIAIGAYLIFRERLSWNFIFGIVLAMFGTALIMGASAINPKGTLVGDALGITTAFFYGGYLLIIKELRARIGTGLIMTVTSIVSLIILVGVSFITDQHLLPETLGGWGILIAIGLIIHCGGQGLITLAFRHMTASFASIALLGTPVLAALFGWLVLNENLTVIQAIGCAAVLGGIAFSQRLNAK